MVTPTPPHTHPPSTSILSLALSLSFLLPPSTSVLVMLVSLFSPSGSSSPLLDVLLSHCQRMTHEEEEEEEVTRRSCCLFSPSFPSLKKKERKKERPDQSNNQKKGHIGYIYIHTKEKETLLFSILLFKEGIFLPFPPLSFSTPIFSSEILVLSNYSPWTSLGFQVRHACVVCGASSFFFYYLSWLTRPPNWRRIGGKWMWMQ